MKKRQHLGFTLLLALIVCLVGVIGLTSCGGEKLTGIYVAKSDSPRLNYVEGQELDLTGGVITVVGSEGERKVPFNDEGVTVTGYDSSKIGEQTVTVQYGELSTSITVSVIPRIVPETFENKYFVGDSFNKEIGKIRIATDDAQTFTVNMSDNKIELVSFDSSKAGNVTVTVRYTADSKSYDCQFDVTVYEHASVKFTAPTKKNTYLSHEDTLPNVEGGFFTVVSNDGKLTKYVPLTTDHITGFDLSAANINNRTEETAFEQVLKVNYLGFEDEYKIKIIFSGVSVLKDYTYKDAANPENNGILTEIDWSADSDLIKVMTEEQIAAAIDAVNTYYDLGDDDKALITKSSKEIIASAGAVALFDEFLTEIQKFENTIRLENDPEKGVILYLPCKTFEQTRDDSVILTDDESTLSKLAALLRQIEADFGKTVLAGETTIDDHVYVYSEETQNKLMNLLVHLVNVYEPFADIPNDWTVDDLVEYKDGIVSAAVRISNETYYEDGFSGYYSDILSKWREKDDYFEIMYSYLLYKHENGLDFMANYVFGQIPMLGKLETWYNSINEIIKYENFFVKYYDKEAFLSDISPFMFYYFSILELSEEIKNGDDQLVKDIYNAYDIDYINRVYMYTYSAGYLYHVGGNVDSESFNNLWAAYYDVLKLLDTGELSAEEHQEVLVAMVDAFEALSPSELYGFLSSLNLMYSSTDGSVYVLSYTEDAYPNIFCCLLRDYYGTYLSESARPLMLKLLTAMENYALLGIKADALEVFQSTMAELISDYAALPTDADRDNFDLYLGGGYEKYLEIYNLSKELVPAPQLTAEESAMMDRLALAINRYNTVFAKITNVEKIPMDLFGALCSLYGDVDKAYRAFVSAASEEALIYMYEKQYEISGKNYTLEVAYASIDSIITGLLVSQTAGIIMADGSRDELTLWEIFSQLGVGNLIADMADLIYYGYYPEEVTLEKAYVDTVISDLNKLTLFQRSILSSLGIDTRYRDSLGTYYNTNLSESGAAMAGKLIEAEIAYLNYAFESENEEYKTAFTTLMAEIVADYSSVSDEDKAYLNANYDYYVDLYEEVIADTETDTETGTESGTESGSETEV